MEMNELKDALGDQRIEELKKEGITAARAFEMLKQFSKGVLIAGTMAAALFGADFVKEGEASTLAQRQAEAQIKVSGRQMPAGGSFGQQVVGSGVAVRDYALASVQGVGIAAIDAVAAKVGQKVAEAIVGGPQVKVDGKATGSLSKIGLANPQLNQYIHAMRAQKHPDGAILQAIQNTYPGLSVDEIVQVSIQIHKGQVQQQIR